MKGDDKVIELLNEVLCAELTAINQYFIHSMMQANWGLPGLAAHSRHESIDEMKHAQEIIARILFLDGVPNMQRYMRVLVGQDVEEQLAFDLKLEHEAVARLNAGIARCREVGDNGSALLLEKILAGEEEHIDWIEAQQHLIKAIGVQNYLANHALK